MSQTWSDDVFNKAHAYDTDLGNMETNFAALKSMFSGGSAPSNTVAGMPWFDTADKILKLRNAANASWLGLMHGDTSQKIWVYRDSAIDGWAIDSSVSDKVLALKGGTTYTTGGVSTGGSWKVSGITAENESTHTHQVSAHDHGAATGYASISGLGESYFQTYADTGTNKHTHTISSQAAANTASTVAHTHTISQDSTWRVAASTGTLQYLDL